MADTWLNALKTILPVCSSVSTFNLTVTKKGIGSGTVTSSSPGIDCGNDCSEAYGINTLVTLTATPASDSAFVGWSGGNCSGTGRCIVTMNKAVTVVAEFRGKYSITGNIQKPIYGVLMTLNGSATGTVTTDFYGNYAFRGLPNGNYTVTPSKAGYTLAPVNRSVTINGANVTNQNFATTYTGGGTGGGTYPGGSATYSLLGTVKSRTGSTMAGVTITLSGGASRTTTTNSSGTYIISGLANGNYTITPGKIGYAFTPVNRSVTINRANIVGQNFTGTVQ
jgi:Carboxypeptidase regulatory-like domain/Divergent InlB B-repeat domain